MIPLLVIPRTLDFIFGSLGVLSVLIFSFLLYRIIVEPTLRALKERMSQPPEEGFEFEVVLENDQRSRIVSIGQLDADINTQLQGIKEDHLILKFHRVPDTEEYDLTIVPGGNVFYRRPHASKIEQIREQEKFESHELIGHPATVRIAAIVQHGRPLQYLEFELSTGYFVDRHGQEKMKFTILLKKIFPGVDRDKPLKKGIYRFARQRVEEEEEI
jgi:hypothetical protein